MVKLFAMSCPVTVRLPLTVASFVTDKVLMLVDDWKVATPATENVPPTEALPVSAICRP